jgi:hypothetical protein
MCNDRFTVEMPSIESVNQTHSYKDPRKLLILIKNKKKIDR